MKNQPFDVNAFLNSLKAELTDASEGNSAASGKPVIPSTTSLDNLSSTASQIAGSTAKDSCIELNAARKAIDQFIADWTEAIEERPAKTIGDVQRSFRLLLAFCTQETLNPLRRVSLIRYRDYLLKERALSRKTVRKYLSLIGVVYQVALDNEKLAVNPATLIRVPRPKREKRARLPFTEEELTRLFRSCVYSDGHRPLGGGGEAVYWLPLIALFTGMRMEEIAQLKPSHILNRVGIYYFRVTDNDDNAGLKTNSSDRRVPVHKELLRLNFIGYVEAMSSEGCEYLFPDLRPDCLGKRSGNFSKFFSRYLRKTVKIEDRRKVFHSFRHNLRQACRDARIDEEVADALMGHSGRGTGRGYGDLYPLEPLAEAIDRIVYPVLVLPSPWSGPRGHTDGQA